MSLKNKLKLKLFLSTVFFCGALFIFSAEDASAYTYSASAISPVKEYATQVSFDTITWTEVSSITGVSPRPANSLIIMEVKAGDVAAPDGTWTNGGNWTAVTNGQSLSFLGGKKYLQYQVVFSYDDLSNMPGVSDVTITDTVYSKNQTRLTSINLSSSSEVDFVQENAADGTDFMANAAILHSSSPSPFFATGGSVTIVDGYKIHTFLSNDNFVPNMAGEVEYLVVAGGGSGRQGGGGAGGFRTGTGYGVSAQNYSVIVGAGGVDSNGGNSVFSGITSIGGGRGGHSYSISASSGGSGGGGGSYQNQNGGVGVIDQGNKGGDTNCGTSFFAAGGGGANTAGISGCAYALGIGGDGKASSITGSTVYYAGGGGGGTSTAGGAAGGVGGGGRSGYSGVAAVAGTPNTGGGGGGDLWTNYAPGGSGIVVLKYPAPIYTENQAYYLTTSSTSQKNTSTWKHIRNVTLEQDTPINTTLKYLVSFNNRTTWKYWNGSTWLTSDLTDLETNGMSKATLESITESQWEETGGFTRTADGKLDFAISLKTTDTTATPLLSNINIEYELFPLSLLSSPYNTGASDNLLAEIKWNENVPEGANVKFQMRSAPDNAGSPNWAAGSGWCGPVNCAVTTNDIDYAVDFYETTPTGETANPIHITGSNDQWIQYIVWLENSTTAVTPILSGVTLTYVVNSPPQVQNVSAIQNSNGTVAVAYEIKDPDTTTGILDGFLDASLEYCTVSCDTPGSETWVNANALSGDWGLVAAQEESFTAHSVIWTPKTDYPNQYNANMKVRIRLDDNEAANNVTYGASNNFSLDVKNPTNVGVVIDHTKSSNNLTLTTPADDSTYQIAYSNYSDFRDASFEAFPGDNKKTYNNLTADPATVYIRVKDEKNNYTDISATTPAQPSHIVYYDTSNEASGEYREFIAWDVVSEEQVGSGFASYDIYRADRLESDGTAVPSYTFLDSVVDRNTNFFTDLNLDNSKHYYYKIFIKDTAGNISQYSSVVDDNPNGQGGSDQTAPTLSNVNVSNINTTSATITWNTDELSDSSVGYSENSTYLPERGLASMVTAHEIVLTNLVPGTTYNIRVKSHDSVGNLGQNDKDNPGATPIENFTFETLPGPAISGVTIPNISNNQATIDWKTSTDSSGYVVYSDTVSDGALVNPKEFGTPELVGSPVDGKYSHSQTITTYNDLPLVPNTRYYFYVKSVDGDSNISIDNNAGMFYELLTTEDNDPPIISDIETPLITKDGTIVSWTTNEPATSKVSYSTVDGGPYSSVVEVLTYDRSHYVILGDLDPDKDYYFEVTSQDINANSKTSDEQETFKTLKDLEFQHEPLAAISFNDPNPSMITDTVAVISFNSDQNANCFVEYGTESGNLNAVPSKEGDDIFNRGHNIQLNGLIFLTKYYYKVTCEDNLENVISSSEKDFTTKEKNYTATSIGELIDSTSPTISNIKIADINGESATISWDTDEKGNSTVRYGISDVSEVAASDSIVNSDKGKYATAHSVVLSGLIPATRYVFIVSSIDIAGNIAQSSQDNFTTSSPSSISFIKAQSKELGQATISWKTNAETTSTVEYGLSTSYGEKKESTSFTTEHSLNLSGLNQGNTYHFRVKGKDKDGKFYASSDQTFDPKSPPIIENIVVDEITEHGAVVSFTTNVPTDATVAFQDVQNGDNSGTQGDPDLTIDHRIKLIGLNSGTTYKTTLSVRDEQGTQSVQVAKDIITIRDENPPKIENVKTDSALTQSDKVQAIISWKTDEQATSSILYKEGRNGEEKEIKITDNLTVGHIGVVTIFKPGTVYNFKVKSIDASGNQGISSDFALLTPKKRENIIQIIIANFVDIFGWAR
ncbi:MAG: hypothetical protein US57_C0002G0053 [Candidatus Moranbacteria bacterium GW2011_GWC2_37_73]|nr:MAG: hypothetical protein UR95_C0002G0151 [Parcubacteria group bacterium GW2011_GWC1_36_108]KKQ01006.1 MAG: hypothetical protein US09_C0003G0006 [Candidatus Moranbacteria bacterium GW2011_GWD1_36_198]KKQ02408.1 MAG: hypothetical protein US10_C0001G0006 [Candidatus Moranbacteria bacterium GW2011_GWD2_36_198]KKQ40346.1 MAG: hypothetical protein US57_C0002G0053 [Candidatus Moranbacteria bacterium GW2011_GWC2_37_73]HAS00146.1 hypothetical protein [Candidatus Moranbacteria bacterium]